jgi:hypothetical protein
MAGLDGNKEKSLEQLLIDHAAAKTALEAAMAKQDEDLAEAREIEEKAEARVIDARNMFNGIARKIDEALAELRAEAPAGTAWQKTAVVHT